MKLKICLFIFFIAFKINIHAQIGAIDYKSNEYLRFKSSKTYVLKTGNKMFDDAVATAFNECWKVTPFEFIDDDQIKKLIDHKDASFIIFLTNNVFSYSNAQIIGLISGGKRKLNLYESKDMLASASINSSYGSEGTYTIPTIENAVQCMVNTMDIVEKNDIRGNDAKIRDRLMSYYKTQSYKIKDRVLLVNKETIEKEISESEFTNIYPYKFEYCSQQKIDDAITNKSKNYYYLKISVLNDLDLFVFDPSTGEVVYGDLLGLKVKQKYIEEMVRAIIRK